MLKASAPVRLERGGAEYSRLQAPVQSNTIRQLLQQVSADACFMSRIHPISIHKETLQPEW